VDKHVTKHPARNLRYPGPAKKGYDFMTGQRLTDTQFVAKARANGEDMLPIEIEWKRMHGGTCP
jgi:hypothetical protein